MDDEITTQCEPALDALYGALIDNLDETAKRIVAMKTILLVLLGQQGGTINLTRDQLAELIENGNAIMDQTLRKIEEPVTGQAEASQATQN
jgi:hypothetical protein